MKRWDGLVHRSPWSSVMRVDPEHRDRGAQDYWGTSAGGTSSILAPDTHLSISGQEGRSSGSPFPVPWSSKERAACVLLREADNASEPENCQVCSPRWLWSRQAVASSSSGDVCLAVCVSPGFAEFLATIKYQWHFNIQSCHHVREEKIRSIILNFHLHPLTITSFDSWIEISLIIYF